MCVLCMYLKHIILHSDADEGARHTYQRNCIHMLICTIVVILYNLNATTTLKHITVYKLFLKFAFSILFLVWCSFF